MNNQLSIISLTLFLLMINLQAQEMEWVQSMGSTGPDHSFSIEVDSSGNIYTAGYFSGTVDFDPGPGVVSLSANDTSDIFVQKSDPSGKLLWVKSMGGNLFEIAKSISLDLAGNIYVTGIFEGTADFDPGPGNFPLTSHGSADIFVMKLDINGDLIWAKSMGGPSFDDGKACMVDNAGNIVITGIFQSTADFDPGQGTHNLNSVGNIDVFIQKFDTNGNYLWVKSFGSTSGDHSNDLSIDSKGNILTTGRFEGTVDFDPGPSNFNLTSNGDNDIYVHKIDANGNFLWAKAIGGNGYDISRSVCTDKIGNVYATGSFSDTVDFDSGSGTSYLNSFGKLDIFILKLNSSGDFIWSKSAGGMGNDVGYGISVDDYGNVYSTGRFTGIVDFDPGTGITSITSAGNDDIYIHKLDSLGNFFWIKSMGGPDHDFVDAMYVNKSGNVYTTGTFYGTGDFDPGAGIYNLSAAGYNDIFIHKLDVCKIVSDTSISLHNNTLTANNSNATYQWLNCDSNFAFIPGETKQSFTALKNGNYAVLINEYGCTDTSACVSINSVGLEEFHNSLEVRVYPNPTSDNLFISFEKTIYDLEVIITNIQGKVILKKYYSSLENTNLNLDAAPGFYLLTIKTQENQQTIKFTKD